VLFKLLWVNRRATEDVTGHSHAFIATHAVIVHAASIVQASATTHAAVEMTFTGNSKCM